MRKILSTAAAIAATLALTPAPAQASAQWSHIRYVSLNRCDSGACGPWRISTIHGNHLSLPDAQIHPLSKRGNPIKDLLAPIGVNGNGTRVAYLRASDSRLVVRDTGGALYVMPQSAFPKGVSQRYSDLKLSLDGAKLAVSLMNGSVKLYDVAAGRHLSTLPKGAAFRGFSGDGGEILAEEGDALVSYTVGGRELARSTVKTAGTVALNADGVTIAWLTQEKGKGHAVLWDLVSDKANVSTWVWVPDYGGMIQQTEMLDWTANKQLTLHVVEDAMHSPRKMRVLQLDLATSRFTVRDRYTIRPQAYGFESCGG